MEFGARGNRDNPRLPLSLGLTSVRFIVNKIEAEYARAAAASSAQTNLELVKYDPNADEGYEDYYDPPLHAKGRVWSRFAVNLGIALSRCIPSVTFGNFGALAVTVGFVAPRMISYLLLYPFCRLVFGTLYPAYASYKAVRTKNLKEYVKWMMYWIVFALFTCTETFTDVFLSWFPFYYEVKIVLVLWLLSPATKGSSILYRKFVHPALCRREQEIDEYIAKAKDQGYHTVLNLGTKGVNYATTVIMQTAIKGGGGLVQQLRKSYSLSDLTECDPQNNALEAEDVMTESRTIRRAAVKSGFNTRRSASESNSRSPMYFPEVDADVTVRGARPKDEPDFGHIKSSEDISSGYSSCENSMTLTRTASLTAASRVKARARTTITAIKRPQAHEGEAIIEEFQEDDSFEFANMPPLLNLSQNLYISDSDPPFIYQLVGNQVRIIQVLGSDIPNIPKFNKANNNPDRWDQNEAYEEASSTVDDDNNKTLNNSKPAGTKINKSDTSHKNSDVEKSSGSIKHEQKEENYNIVIESDKKDNTLSINVPLVIEGDISNDSSNQTLKQNPFNKEIEELHEENNTEGPHQQSTSQNATENKTTSEFVHQQFKVVDTDIETTRLEIKATEDPIESTSLDTSLNDNDDDDDSDDEASFGTPEGSPKSKRKSPVGKYGKRKAPAPPIATEKTDAENKQLGSKESMESLTDIVNKLPDKGFKETGAKSLQVVNPIAEKKRRHKSKSPGRLPKSSGSGIGKLLQFPGKLAFWSKNDDKNKDNVSISSGDGSRRSSTIEKTADDFQSCSALNEIPDIQFKDIAEDQLSFKDAEFVESEISHDIKEKSDELQKLIEAKLESHPEYKFVSLHEEVEITSKSTDV